MSVVRTTIDRVSPGPYLELLTPFQKRILIELSKGRRPPEPSDDDSDAYEAQSTEVRLLKEREILSDQGTLESEPLLNELISRYY